jgi:hypothetical protein
MVENDLFNCRLKFGTEFQTKINGEGKYEIVKILSESKFITRRFLLNSQFTESDYRVLGDEIIRQGGFWQVDMGSLATVNLPPDSTIDLDELFKTFEFHPAEIKD